MKANPKQMVFQMNHATLLISLSQLSLIQTHVETSLKKCVKTVQCSLKCSNSKIWKNERRGRTFKDCNYFEICFIAGDPVVPEISGEEGAKTSGTLYGVDIILSVCSTYIYVSRIFQNPKKNREGIWLGSADPLCGRAGEVASIAHPYRPEEKEETETERWLRGTTRRKWCHLEVSRKLIPIQPSRGSPRPESHLTK